MELSDPQYSASQQSLTYTAELLDIEGISTDLSRMSGGAASATEIPAGTLTDVSVFIDDSSAAVGADRTVTISSDGLTKNGFAEAVEPALQAMAADQAATVGIEVDYQYDLRQGGPVAQLPVLLTHLQLSSEGGQKGTDPQALAGELATDALAWLARENPASGEFVVHLTER